MPAKGKRKRPRGRYPQVYEGEWTCPAKRGYRMSCCDCSLVHRINFRIVKRPNGRLDVELQTFRDNRSTAACRRGKIIVISNHPT